MGVAVGQVMELNRLELLLGASSLELLLGVSSLELLLEVFSLELLLGVLSLELLLGVSSLELLLEATELLLGADTVMLPHCAVIPAQELALLALLTLTATLPVLVGMRPAGVHVRLLVTVVPLQRTVGAANVAPTVPVATKPVQVNELLMVILLQVPETLLGLAVVPQFTLTPMLV